MNPVIRLAAATFILMTCYVLEAEAALTALKVNNTSKVMGQKHSFLRKSGPIVHDNGTKKKEERPEEY